MRGSVPKIRTCRGGNRICGGRDPPPDYIRDLLSARIEREPQTAPTEVQPSPSSSEETVEESPRPISAALSRPPESRRERPKLFPWFLAVVLAGMGFFAAYLWKTAQETNVQLQAKTSAAEADAGTLRSELENSNEAAGNLGKILTALGKPGARMAHLIDQSAGCRVCRGRHLGRRPESVLRIGKFPSGAGGQEISALVFFAGIKSICRTIQN